MRARTQRVPGFVRRSKCAKRGAQGNRIDVRPLMPRWRIDLISKTLRHVGTIEAETAEQAIDEAAKLFRIKPAVRDKLIATKVPET